MYLSEQQKPFSLCIESNRTSRLA